MNASNRQDIRDGYRQTTDRTLRAWSDNPNAGGEKQLGYHPTKLAYSIGTLFSPPSELDPAINEFEQLAAGDKRVSIVPRSSLHFTFLALTPQKWETLESMLVLDPVLGNLCNLTFELEDLQLLPMPNALLLAGIPTQQTLDSRIELIERLIPTPAADWLKERYGENFPPLFWHTTLARSRTEFAPPEMRQSYFRYRELRLDKVSLPAPRLWAINFDWTIRNRI